MPFTVEQFMKVFETYNRAVYPAQWVLLILAGVAIYLAARPSLYSDKIVATLLALLWLWTGIAYHLAFFSEINGAAYLFGLLCVAQAFLFLFAGVTHGELVFRAKTDAIGIGGGLIVVFALLLYPALSALAGHAYPRMPTFGVPCPTTILTFGLLLWAESKVPLYLLTIPSLWSVLGLIAAIYLDMWEDLGLLVAGVAGTLLVVMRNRTLRSRGVVSGTRRPAAIDQ